MVDLKQKFIDILFEDEDETYSKEEIEEVKEVKVPEKKVETIKKVPTSIKASDILYHKPTTSVFVNLDEPKHNTNNDEIISNDNGEYEFSTKISPIFGVLEEPKSSDSYKNNVNEAQVKKPENSHLDIITSPIYGYGNGDDSNSMYSYNSEDEEKSLHDLFDEDTYLNDSYENSSQKDDLIEDSEEISLFKLFGETK